MKKLGDLIRHVLERSEVAYDSGFQIPFALEHPSSDISLEIRPDKFVRVEFRGICWQEEKFQHTLGGFNKLANMFGAMHRMIIGNHINRFFGPVDQAAKKLAKYFRRQIGLIGHKAQQTLGANGRQNVDLETRPGGLHNRGLSFKCPGGARNDNPNVPRIRQRNTV